MPLANQDKGQDWAKMGPRWAKMRPRWAKMGQEWTMLDKLCRHWAEVGQISCRSCRKNGQKACEVVSPTSGWVRAVQDGSQNGSKMGPKWVQDGSKMGPKWIKMSERDP